MFNNFNTFRVNGTDMYILLTGLVGTDDTSDMFADKEASALFLEDLRINVPQLKEWLRLTAKGVVKKSIDSTFLYRLENK